MTKIIDVKVQLFNVPLAEVLSDAKHGDHTHFELITATITTEDGSVGTGPYTMQYRQELLTSLTDLQEEVGMELISENEVNIIKQIWNEELIHMAKIDAGQNATTGEEE